MVNVRSTRFPHLGEGRNKNGQKKGVIPLFLKKRPREKELEPSNDGTERRLNSGVRVEERRKMLAEKRSAEKKRGSRRKNEKPGTKSLLSERGNTSSPPETLRKA